jgi:phosphatidylinositol-3-phosphatase
MAWTLSQGGIGGQGGLASIGPTRPAVDHVFVVILENHGLNCCPTIDSTNGVWHSTTSCPFINNTLISGGFLCTNYTDDVSAQNSLPNYMQIIAGSDFGLNSDANPPTNVQAVGVKTIVDSIESVGKTWRCYAEAYVGGSGGTTITDGDSSSNSVLGTGHPLYVEHHVPFAFFNSIRNSTSRSQQVQDFTNFSASADFSTTSVATTPNFAFIVPNMNDNMHDGTAASCDSWMSTNVGIITASKAWTSRKCVLIAIWDETDHTTSEIVPCIFYGSQGSVKVNVTSANAYSHYSLLATILWLLDLPPVGMKEMTAPVISEAFV